MPLKATERDVYDFFSKAGKVEKNTRHPQRLLEPMLYSIIQGESGIPNMKVCGTDGDHNVLVMDLL